MKKKIKLFLTKSGLGWVIKITRLVKTAYANVRYFFEKVVVSGIKKLWHLSRRRRLVDQYLLKHPIPKLQLGGGENLLDGWLNTDFMPRHKDVVMLDGTKPFFFKDNTFDYIFCEHMIEHITCQEAMSMLKECSRILKPGGKIRISTPDLEVHLGLFAPQKSTLQKDYINWIGKNWLERQGIQCFDEVLVLNLMMRGWGHKFLYDYKTLKSALAETGFTDIAKVSSKQSQDEHFKGIDKHGDHIKNIKGIKMQSGSNIDNQMNEFASLTVEAIKK